MISPRVRSVLRGRTSLEDTSVARTLWRCDPLARSVRECMIREAAYFKAQQRGFAPGRELEDWLAAEREIDHRTG
jgi:hypothetical protein